MGIKNNSLLFIILLFLVSCTSDTKTIFEESSDIRTKKAKEKLVNLLTSAKEGWEMLYFRDVKELFSNPDRNIIKSIPYSHFLTQKDKLLGEGGFTFLVKFSQDGKVQMLSDIDFNSSVELKESEYNISQNTYLQLNFISPNYIYNTGQTSFLFYKEEDDGTLIFTTNRYENPHREYIILRPLKIEESDWKEKMKGIFSTKLVFERNKVTLKSRLIITDNFDNEVFKSDFPLKNEQYNNRNSRYVLFVKNMKPHLYGNEYYTALGSGYTALENKIKFLPGFRVNDSICFTDFEAKEEKYVSVVKGYKAVIE